MRAHAATLKQATQKPAKSPFASLNCLLVERCFLLARKQWRNHALAKDDNKDGPECVEVLFLANDSPLDGLAFDFGADFEEQLLGLEHLELSGLPHFCRQHRTPHLGQVQAQH